MRCLLPFLAACSLSTAPTQAPPPPGVAALAVGPILPGERTALTVHGAPANQQVAFLFGTNEAPGLCPPPLNGTCLGITNHQVLGFATANSQGIAELSVPVPASVPNGFTGYFQAGWLTAGPAVLTDVKTRTAGIDDPDLLLTEIVVAPTNGEFIEVYNPSSLPADLSNVWIADNNTAYQLPLDDGAPSSSDFRVRFPDGATLGAGETVVVALEGADFFLGAYGFLPDYDVDPSDPAAPAMVGDFTGLAGLSNGDEVVHLFRWDGASDAVVDLDYLLYGNDDEALDRTGVIVGTHTYLPDTPSALQAFAEAPSAGESLHRCVLDESSQQSDGNGFGGTDETSEALDTTWSVLDRVTPGEITDCDATPLTVTDLDFDLPFTASLPAGTYVYDDAAAFQAAFGVAAPASVDWSTERVAIHSVGAAPWPGSRPDITAASFSGGMVELTVTENSPGNGCQTLDWTPTTFRAVTLSAPPAAITGVTADTTANTFDCAADGLADDWDCSHSQLCAPNAICSSLTLWEPGYCREIDTSGRFNGAGNLAISPNASSSQTLTISGLASVPEDVIVTLDIIHPDPSQLRITLLNLYDTPSMVWDQEDAGGANLSISRPIWTPSDEDINGPWTLMVEDLGGNAGTVVSWDLEVTSRYD